MRPPLPERFLRLLQSVEKKRARTVIDHILERGHITTEELRDRYGYHHPPRAIRDVREHGVPLEMFRVVGSDGRRIAAYRFGDPAQARSSVLAGRTAIVARIRKVLLEQTGARCNIYCSPFPERELQVDHRIPFEIAGDPSEPSEDAAAYMLVCASANRAKSWSCEHCPNWERKEADTCRTCYWAFPEDYRHVATREVRRLDIVWAGDETDDYDVLRVEAGGRDEMPDFVKRVLRSLLVEPSE